MLNVIFRYNIDVAAIIRSNILAMHPYSPGKPIEELRRELGLEHIVKLASNENPLGPSPKAVAAMQAAMLDLHLYPDAGAFEVKAAIARKFGRDPGGIVIGNGSDELIHLIGLLYLGNENDEMIVGHPSFVRYDAAAHIASTKLIQISLDEDLAFDIEAMLAAVTPNTKLLWIANPNNPTGTITSKAKIDHLFSQLPPHVTVVLDEAYFEFADGESEYPNGLAYLDAGRSVIVLRTLSKAYGLAGIRLGYGFAHPDVVDAMNRARAPFNCNSLAQVAAIAAFDDEEHLQRSILANREGMETIAEAVKAVGGRPIPSHANFILADFGRPTRPIYDALLREGIIVRPCDAFGMPNFLRVSIGTADENRLFKCALTKVLGTLSAASS